MDKSKRKPKKLPFYLLLLVLIGIFCFSAYQVIRYVADGVTQQSRYDDLAALVKQNQTEETQEASSPTQAEETGETEETEATEPGILAEYQAIFDLNPDTVGWLTVDGTDIEYPVLQTPEDADYYLHHNFDGEYNAHGCIYADGSCDVFAPSDNVTLYGHNMKDGTMFATLSNYISQDFWEEYGYIQFDTLTEHHTYQVFAVFRTSANSGQGFAYNQFVNAVDEADFDEFIAQIKTLAYYDTGITPAYGDKIICLSTCEYTLSNGRLVVAAVRID